MIAQHLFGLAVAVSNCEISFLSQGGKNIQARFVKGFDVAITPKDRLREENLGGYLTRNYTNFGVTE